MYNKAMVFRKMNISLLLSHRGLLVLLLLGGFVFWPNQADAIAPIIWGAIVAVPVIANLFGFGTDTLGNILTAISNLPAAILIGVPVIGFTLILTILAEILVVIAAGLNAVLIAVIKQTLSIAVIYGEPGTVLQVGWEISRNIANMVFVLGIVIIGLANILRLQNYKIQKALPFLLIMMLLVNFSQVFVGIIVDSANLMISFFIGKMGSLEFVTSEAGTLVEHAVAQFGNFFDILGKDSGQYISGLISPLAETIGLIVFLLLFSLALFAVMFLFIVRVAVLWILSILAPIAFAAAVLPATKKYWSMWFGQLIQWSLVGLPMALFLYLAGFAQIGGEFDGIAAPGFAKIIIALISPLFVLIFIVAGFGLSMSLAPAAAKGVVGFGMATGVGLGVTTGAGLWRKLEGSNIRDGGGRISRFGAAMQKWGTADKDAGALRKAGATFAKYSGIAPFAGRAVELASKEATMRLGMKDAREQEKWLKEVGNKDSFSVVNIVNEELAMGKLGKPVNWNKITALLTGLRNRKDGDDIEEAFNKLMIPPEMLADTIKAGLRIGPPGYRPLLKSFFGPIFTNPRKYGWDADVDENGNIKGVTTNAEGKLIAQPGAGKDALWLAGQQKSLPSKFTPQDVEGDTMATENLDVRTKAGRYFVDTIIDQRDADFMGAFGRRARKDERDRLMEYILTRHGKEGQSYDEKVNTTLTEYAVNAPGVLKYMTSSGARSIGVGLDIGTGEINRMSESGNILREMLKELKENNRNEMKNAFALMGTIRGREAYAAREQKMGADTGPLMQEIAQSKETLRAMRNALVGVHPDPARFEHSWSDLEDKMTFRVPQGGGGRRRGGGGGAGAQP